MHHRHVKKKHDYLGLPVSSGITFKSTVAMKDAMSKLIQMKSKVVAVLGGGSPPVNGGEADLSRGVGGPEAPRRLQKCIMRRAHRERPKTCP